MAHEVHVYQGDHDPYICALTDRQFAAVRPWLYHCDCSPGCPVWQVQDEVDVARFTKRLRSAGEPLPACLVGL